MVAKHFTIHTEDDEDKPNIEQCEGGKEVSSDSEHITIRGMLEALLTKVTFIEAVMRGGENETRRRSTRRHDMEMDVAARKLDGICADIVDEQVEEEDRKEGFARCRVAKWLVDRGFGFAELEEGGGQVFIHSAAVVGDDVLRVGSLARVKVIKDRSRADEGLKATEAYGPTQWAERARLRRVTAAATCARKAAEINLKMAKQAEEMVDRPPGLKTFFVKEAGAKEREQESGKKADKAGSDLFGTGEKTDKDGSDNFGTKTELATTRNTCSAGGLDGGWATARPGRQTTQEVREGAEENEKRNAEVKEAVEVHVQAALRNLEKERARHQGVKDEELQGAIAKGKVKAGAEREKERLVDEAVELCRALSSLSPAEARAKFEKHGREDLKRSIRVMREKAEAKRAKEARNMEALDKARFAYEWAHRNKHLGVRGPQCEGLRGLLERYSSSWKPGSEGEWALSWCENHGMRYEDAKREQEEWLKQMEERRRQALKAEEERQAAWTLKVKPVVEAAQKNIEERAAETRRNEEEGQNERTQQEADEPRVIESDAEKATAVDEGEADHIEEGSGQVAEPAPFETPGRAAAIVAEDVPNSLIRPCSAAAGVHPQKIRRDA